MTKNSHSRGPHIFPYCRKFCKQGGKTMTKFELVVDTCLLCTFEARATPHSSLDCCWFHSTATHSPQYIVIAANFFSPTHHSLRFGPTARTFGVENLSIFRPHIVLINRVKSPLWCKLDYNFIYLLCFVVLLSSYSLNSLPAKSCYGGETP